MTDPKLDGLDVAPAISSANAGASSVPAPNAAGSPTGPDPVALVEAMYEHTAGLESLLACMVHLIEKVPRTGSLSSEQALLRLGRVIERCALAATYALDFAERAVHLARTSRPLRRDDE